MSRRLRMLFLGGSLIALNIFYFRQASPFLMAAVFNSSGLQEVDAVVERREIIGGDYPQHLIFFSTESKSCSSSAIVDLDFFNSISAGSTVKGISWGNSCFLREDSRWEVGAEKYLAWLMLLLCGIGLGILVAVLRSSVSENAISDNAVRPKTLKKTISS